MELSRCQAAVFAALTLVSLTASASPACEPILSAATSPAALTFTLPTPALRPSQAPRAENAARLRIRPAKAVSPHRGNDTIKTLKLLRPVAAAPGQALVPLKAPASPYSQRVEAMTRMAPPQMVQGIDYGPYMRQLELRLKKGWARPSKQEFLPVAVTFKLLETGQIANIKIQKSAGDEAVDAAALRAVSQVSPVAALPAGAPHFVNVRFVFENQNGSSCCCGGPSCNCGAPGACGNPGS